MLSSRMLRLEERMGSNRIDSLQPRAEKLKSQEQANRQLNRLGKVSKYGLDKKVVCFCMFCQELMQCKNQKPGRKFRQSWFPRSPDKKVFHS